MLDRRQLLGHLAAVASFTLMGKNPAFPMTITPDEALRLDYERAVRGLIAASVSGDWSAWEAGSEQEKPERWRLARAVVAAGEGDMSDPFATRISEALRSLWVELTQPKAAEIIEIVEWPEA